MTVISGSQRALIMIGDAYPHEWKDYHDEILAKYPDAAKVAVDWRDEAEKLVKMVRLTSVRTKKREKQASLYL